MGFQPLNAMKRKIFLFSIIFPLLVRGQYRKQNKTKSNANVQADEKRPPTFDCNMREISDFFMSPQIIDKLLCGFFFFNHSHFDNFRYPFG
jgi:hypothetical protein